MRPHQLELPFETDPALALRQFHEQIGRGDVGPEPRHQAVTAIAPGSTIAPALNADDAQRELAERM
jgi:hypothetical protein